MLVRFWDARGIPGSWDVGGIPICRWDQWILVGSWDACGIVGFISGSRDDGGTEGC